MNLSFPRINPLAAGAAASIIVCSLVVAAAFAGLIPSAGLRKADMPTARPASAQACAQCGTVVGVRAVPADGRSAWRVVTRMDDDSMRAVSTPERPALAVGDRVRIADGRATRISQVDDH